MHGQERANKKRADFSSAYFKCLHENLFNFRSEFCRKIYENLLDLVVIVLQAFYFIIFYFSGVRGIEQRKPERLPEGSEQRTVGLAQRKTHNSR